MRIGELARQLEVSTHTIRRLEARGLIRAARDWNRHRRFTGEDLERLRELVYGGPGRYAK